ncbi:TIGR03557 family F420-dependent LLM class oxidoreductase [Halegenticoccus tardaugens]|uniref:TIGR03557 family F420-dependent LLM class oxidoreductase n=1 Tax=Halegenticoccus tardaugens TaxID=2071624 RepID=UPI00100A805E|nr:TIGR03557 family F420-dependent LLM class oxidoreductase [Halegenticoccus tardaugens]
MTTLGYTLSSEEHGPNDLVRYASRAEEVGFDFLSISDHYHPWVSQQGHSPFVWGTLGGVAEAVDDVDVGVGVSAPIMRMHPAIYAQAAATAAAMFDGRFLFGVGTGENLNEHVVGEHWPEHGVRLEMLEEAVDVIRKLWTGENVSHHGNHYTVENAKLFTLPDRTPEVVASAFGPKTAEAAGEWADGLWTLGPQDDLVETFEAGGGEGGTNVTQLSICYAETEDEAVQTALEEWPNSALPGELAQHLPTPKHFEQAASMVTEENIREGSIITDPDPETHVETIRECFDAGFDYAYVHQIGPNQEDFFEFYEEQVIPEFE